MGNLTSEANVIVVGPVRASTLGRTVNATIIAKHVLKGTVNSGSSVHLVWTRQPSHAVPSALNPPVRGSNGYGIFFLKRESGGSLSMVPAMNGDVDWEQVYVPTVPNPPQHIRNVVSASLPAQPSALDKVLVEVLTSAESGWSEDLGDLVATYRQQPSPVLAAAFRRFVSKPDPRFLLVGVQGLLASGDPSLLTIVRQRYAALAASDDLGSLLWDIRFHYLNTSAKAIAAVGQVATDRTVGHELRTAAAGALKRMHTRQSLPFLAALLGDSDSTLRIFAVRGMANFANNAPGNSEEPAPGPWHYRNGETISHASVVERNVSFWRTWWDRHKDELSR